MGKIHSDYVSRGIATLIRNKREPFYAKDLVNPLSQLLEKNITSQSVAQHLYHFTENQYVDKYRDHWANTYMYIRTEKDIPLRDFP